ncbi:MAG: MarR family winged helix-turn-helix transcriptional regulator [Pseudomonadota bacterium]
MPKNTTKVRTTKRASPRAKVRRVPAPAGSHSRIEPARLRPFWESAGVGYFAYRLILTAKLFDSMLVGSTANFRALTPPQLRIVSQLGLLGTGTVRSLAEGAFVDGAEVSRAMRDLQRRRLVQRLPNPTDARSSLFKLTATGQRAYSDCGKHAWSLIKPTLQGLSRSDVAVVDRVLWQLSNHCLTRNSPDPKVAHEWI